MSQSAELGTSNLPLDLRGAPIVPGPRNAEPELLKEAVPSQALRNDIYHFHGEVTVQDAKEPVVYTVAVPAHLQSETVALLVPGLGAIKRTSRHFRNALAQNEGVISVSYEPARKHTKGADNRRHFLNPQHLHVDTLAAIAEDLPQNSKRLDVPNGDAVEDAKLALIAHSMGGLSAAEWSMEHPEKVALLSFIGAIGLEKSSMWKLASRTPDVLINDVAPLVKSGSLGYSPKLARRSVQYFAANPLRTVAEVRSCMKADIAATVFILHELGVPQSVIGFQQDRFFRPDDTFDAVSHVVEHHEVVANAEHTAPQSQPIRIAQVVGRHIRTLAR